MAHRSSLRAALALLACGLAVTPALAKRPFAPALSCGALQSMVHRNGGVVISTSPTTYDRFVSDGSYCQQTEITRPAWTTASDDPQCFIGYTCMERMRENLW